jgi:uncharacterized repeat protein (TIGR01451 family)
MCHNYRGVRVPTKALLGRIIVGACLVQCLMVTPAPAVVVGSSPTLLSSHTVFGNAKGIGATLMLPGPVGTEIRSVLLASSSATLSGLPADAVIEKVYLYWSGTLAQDGVAGPKSADPTVSLTLADGASSAVSAGGACTTIVHPSFGTTFPPFYYCRADVTALVAAHPAGGSYNGAYILGDVDADPGHIDGAGNCTETPNPNCQGKYAAWSMTVVYSAPSETLQRDILIYDGFLMLDHRNGAGGSTGQTSFTMNGFVADSTAQGTLSFFAVESDSQLGQPPQDLFPAGHPFQCSTCQDFVRFNGTTLSDEQGWPGNIFNESAGIGSGIDIDSIDVSSLINPGATSALIEVGSGTGAVINPAPGHGGGELIGYGWTMLALRRPAPNFKTQATIKSVTPSAQGQGGALAYSIAITNAGSLSADNTVVTDALPAGVDYQAGTLQLDGVPCTDAVDGDACSVSGSTLTIQLGTVSSLPPTNSRQISFLGTVGAGTTDGQQLCNQATIVSTQTPAPHTVGPACTTVEQPQLGAVTKTMSDINGGNYQPDDIVQFSVNIAKQSSGSASAITFIDDMPANLQLISVSAPVGSTNISDLNGGAASMGRVEITDISIPSGASSVSLTFLAQFDSVAEFVGKGTAEGAVDGQTICNQASVSAPYANPAILSDDPGVGGNTDPTCATLVYAPVLSTSAKTVVDNNGNRLEPGDGLRYTISLTNTGNRNATVSLVDDMPAVVNSFALVGAVPGSSFAAAPAGTNTTGQLSVVALTVAAGTTETVVFDLLVDGGAANNTSVENCAVFTVVEKPSEGATICSPALSVFSSPELAESTKAVVDDNGGVPLPGDQLTYTITASNTGNQAASAVAISDTLPVGFDNVIPLDGGAYDTGSRTLTWTVGALGAGASETRRFRASIVVPTTNGSVLCNQATITSTELPAVLTDDPATVAADDTTCLTVVSAPDFSGTTKAVQDLDGAPARPGDALRYTITAINGGNETATTIVVSDVVPANLTAVTPLDGGTYDSASRTITWNIASLTPTQQSVLRFEAQIETPLTNATVISNQAFVTADQVAAPGTASDDPATTAADDATSITVTSAANVGTSTKTVTDDNGGAAQPGDRLSYQITVINTGDAISRATVITDVVDGSLDQIVVQDGGTFDSNTRTINWPAEDVIPGTDRVLNFSAQLVVPLADGLAVCNQATISGTDIGAPEPTDDPATGAAGDATCVTVKSEPDLGGSTKTVVDVNGGDIEPGDTLRYEIIVDNIGTQNATNVSVSDVLDVSLTNITPLDGGAYNASTRTASWALPSVVAKTQTTLRLEATVVLPLDTGTEISNQATVDSTETTAIVTDDPNTPATDDATKITVVSAPDFSTSTKSFVDTNGGEAEPGNVLTYTLTINNSGNSAADNIVVSDILDANLEFIGAGQGGTFNSTTRELRWTGATTAALLKLAPQVPVELTITVEIKTPLADQTQICNQGLITSDEITTAVMTDNDLTPAAGDPTCLSVSSVADLSGATLTVVDQNGGDLEPGDAVLYTLVLTNTGTGPAENVVVTDVVPESLTQIQPGEGGQFNAPTRTISWTSALTSSLKSLGVGQSETLTISAVVATPLDNGTEVANQAQISATGLTQTVPSDDPSTPTIDDATTLVVVASADLMASAKTVTDFNGGDIEPGDQLGYSIVARNSGNALARKTIVTDVVDKNLENIQVLNGGVFNAATRTITWDIGDLALSPAGDQSLRFNAQIISPTANGTEISNQAKLASGALEGLTDDPNTPDVGDATKIVVVAKPDISDMTKTVIGANASGKVAPNGLLNYTIEIPNKGTENATNVSVVDQLDENLVDIVVQNGGTYDKDTHTITWLLPELKIGIITSVSFKATVRPNAKNKAKISNQAFATVDGNRAKTFSDDPNTPASDDPTTVEVDAISDLTNFTKEVVDVNGGEPVPGDLLTYNLTVNNTGAAYAFNVVVEDPVSSKLFTDIKPSGGGIYLSSSQTIRWDKSGNNALAEIAPGDSVTLSFNAKIRRPLDDGTEIKNQAILRADDVLEEPSDDPKTSLVNDATIIKVVSRPDFVGSQMQVVDLNGGLVQPGDQLEYVISVTNNGTSASAGTTLLAPIPTHTTYMPNTTRLNGATVPDASAPTAKGVLIGSAGAPAGQILVGANAAASIRYRVRVRQEAQEGTIIGNQGMIKADDIPVALTDDPTTLAALDSTQMVVGLGPNLSQTIKTFDAKPLTDRNGDGIYDVSDSVRYSISITNTGTAAAHNVIFNDPLDPQNRLTYVANSTVKNGKPLTDLADGDEGSFDGSMLRVEIGTIDVGGTVLLTYVGNIKSGPSVTNQGTLRSQELGPELTDSDGNHQNGNSATVLAITGASLPLRVAKTVSDNNGGLVVAGDELLYSISVSNDSSADATLGLTDSLPKGLSLVSGSLVIPPDATSNISGSRVSVTGLKVPANGSAIVLLKATLDTSVEEGESVCNEATFDSLLGTEGDAKACVLIGSPLGTGGLQGVVFRDIGDDDAKRGENDQTLAGYQVQAFILGDANGTPLATGTTDEDGAFNLASLPPGLYSLRVFNSNGVQIGTLSAVKVGDGEANTRDIVIDPTGIVYNSKSGEPVANVRALLYYDKTNTLSAGKLVPEGLLGNGQQGQVTDASGFYKFDMPAGHVYEIKLEPLSSSMQFPSTVVPPNPALAKVGADNEVVANDSPQLTSQGSDLTYFLRHKVASQSDELFNNHIAVDSISSLIRLEKRADRRRASLGDLLTYTITVENRSSRDFTSTGSRVGIEDILPRGLRMIKSSVRRIRRIRSGQTCLGNEVSASDVDGAAVCLDKTDGGKGNGRVIRFGPFPLGSGELVRLVYQVAVGLDTRQGVYRNIAVLKDNGFAAELSNRDEALVTVEPDPDFDQGFLFGKVFCDLDGDGRQGKGDLGIAGARVYLDNGTYSVTDSAGKYHLRDIDPGLRLVKLDTNSLRPGSVLTTDESRVVQFTRGLPAKVNFGSSCKTNWIMVQKVALKPVKGKAPPPKPAGPERMTLAGDAKALRVSADGKVQTTVDADLAILATGGSTKLPANWDTIRPLNVPRVGKSAKRQQLLFNTRAGGGALLGWRLTIWRETDDGQKTLVRRFSGNGKPPAQLLWDGSLGGKMLLSRGRRYLAQLQVVSKNGGGTSPYRTFSVGMAQPPLAYKSTRPHVSMNGHALALDKKLGFSRAVGLVGKWPLLVELNRGDGKSIWIRLGKPVAASPLESKEVSVTGSLTAATLKVGEAFLDTTLFQIALRHKNAGGVLAPLDRKGRLKEPLILRPTFATGMIRDWRLRITTGKGELIRTLGGTGTPPRDIAWDGEGDGGEMAITPGAAYDARLVLFDADGNMGISPPLPFRAAAKKSFGYEATARSLFNTRSGKLKSRYLRRLKKTLRAALKGETKERYRLAIGLAPSVRWPAERWAGYLKSVKGQLVAFLTKEGLKADRYELKVDAIALPAQPVVSRRRRRQKRIPKRKETLALSKIVEANVALGKFARGVRINGAKAKIYADGTFEAHVKAESTLVIELRDEKGHRAMMLLPLNKLPEEAPADSTSQPAAADPKKGKKAVPASAPNSALSHHLPLHVAGTRYKREADGSWLLKMRQGGTLQLRLAQATPKATVTPKATATSKPAGQGSTTQPAGQGSTTQPAKAKALAKAEKAFDIKTLPLRVQLEIQVEEELIQELEEELKRVQAQLARMTGEQQVELAEFGEEVLRKAFGIPKPKVKKGPVIGELPKVAAAKLRVDLPERGVVLKSHEFAVRGKTDPKNKILVNGKKVVVQADGSFSQMVRLPDGKSMLDVKAQDPKGNVGTLRWPVEVSDRALFLMALAEGAIGQPGVELDGDNAHSRIDTDHLMLRGRAVVYLKGRIKGKYLFKNYAVTAHVDTAKQREFEDFFDQVVDPNRYYPIYGDSAKQVRDVNARDKYYVLLQADQSALKVGNFRAGMKGIELLRYDRSLYGGKLDFQKEFLKGTLKPQVKVFYSHDNQRLSRDHNVLRATGGSIYYLRHGHLLEGSERVRLVVRERNTGIELSSVTMARDNDYMLDYPGGRLLFKAPVASVADAGFTINNPTFSLSTLAGHPVYIEVDYEYEGDAEQGSAAWGVQVKNTFFDILTVGGTYISEERAAQTGADYKLYGGDLTYRVGKLTRFTAEVSRSESHNMQNYLSEDGGITYLDLNHTALSSADPRAGNALAYKFKFDLELSDFIKSVKPGRFKTVAYFSHLDRGYFSGNTILDQGRTKYGGRIDIAFSDRDQISFRHDGGVAILPQLTLTQSGSSIDPLQMREVETELTRLRYQMRRGRFELKGELAHMFMRDAMVAGVDSHRATAGITASYRVAKWLRITVAQDGIFYASGNDPQLGNSTNIALNVSNSADWRDRLMSTVGVDLRLSKRFELQIAESVRWSGDNSTSVGVRAQISKSASTYVKQLFGTTDENFNTVTVVGAEDRFGHKLNGRTYGEYQLESGVLGRRNRAILGLAHKWAPWRGIGFSGGYEHQQVFGGILPDGTPTGDSQRDVVHLGFEFTRLKNLKLSTRAEMRYDVNTGIPGLSYTGLSEVSKKSPTSGAQQVGANQDVRQGYGNQYYGERVATAGTQMLLTPGERWQISTRTAASWAVSKDVTLMGRFNYYRTFNNTDNRIEAEAMEIGFGAALRPVEWDWLNIIVKYTHLLEMRPISLTEGLSRRRTYDVASIVAVIDLPWRLQLVEKAAYKRVVEDMDLLANETLSTTMHTILWINRLNLHITKRLDAGAEYRFMRLFMENEGDQIRHGALVELGYWVHDYVRLGAGYNFSSFSDNEFVDQDRDASGAFFRVVGRY